MYIYIYIHNPIEYFNEWLLEHCGMLGILASGVQRDFLKNPVVVLNLQFHR